MKFKTDLDRFTRTNGKKPSPKDKWKAFWRLWRICKQSGSKNSNPFIPLGAENSFHWLLDDNWEWIKLASSPPDKLTLPLKIVPIAIRKLWAENEKRKRKRNKEITEAQKFGIVLGDTDDKLAAAMIRKHGFEVTPREASKIRSQACEKIRQQLIKSGVNKQDIPISDEGVFLLLHKHKGLVK